MMKQILGLAWLAGFFAFVPLVHAQPSAEEQAKLEAAAKAAGEALLDEEVRVIEQARAKAESRATEQARHEMDVRAAEAETLKQTLRQSAAGAENQARAEAEVKMAELARHEAAARAAESAQQREDARQTQLQAAALAQQEAAARVAEEVGLGEAARAAAQLKQDGAAKAAEQARQETESMAIADKAMREQGVSRAVAEALAKISVQGAMDAEVREQQARVKMVDDGQTIVEAQARALVAKQAVEEDRAQAASRGWLEAEAGSAVPVSIQPAKEIKAADQSAALAAAEEKNKALAQAMLKADESLRQAKAVPQEGSLISLYRRAAEMGNSDAQAGLGRIYQQGQGVETDLVQAYKWFNLAAQAGDQAAASDMQLLEGKMGREQIEQAKKLAQQWPEKHK